MTSTVTQLGVADTQANELWSTLQSTSTRFSSTLSPSVLSDLMRFDDRACGADLLPVLAAIVRHMHPLLVYMQYLDRIVELSLFPRQHHFRCDLDLTNLTREDAAQLQVMHVAPLPSSGLLDPAAAYAAHSGSMASLLWTMALRGSHSALLPEIAGPVRYRLAPGQSLRRMPMEPWCEAPLRCLGDEPASVQELAEESGSDLACTRRLLNAVYLQGRIMITRSLPLQRAAPHDRRSVRKVTDIARTAPMRRSSR